jgi:purine-binding chemotaxis protein CheW
MTASATDKAALTNGTVRPAAARQVLTFSLGAQIYGVDILRVQEIRGWSPVTRIPQTPLHVLGVLNLRGAIVPIIDLRMRLGMERVAYNALTVIIVLSVELDSGRRDIGVVVDSVSDVIDIDTASLKPPPNLGMQADTAYIQGLTTVADHMTMLLDIDRLIGGDVGMAADMAPPATQDDAAAA